MRHFLVFGSHPHLSLAEAKAVMGGRSPACAGEMALFDLEEWDGAALQDRLAGIVKLGDVVVDVSADALNAGLLADLMEARPRGDRIEFGCTAYGGTQKEHERVKKMAMALKKELRRRGHTTRWITGDRGEISPAAVAKARLTTEGYDLVIGFFAGRTIVGLTTHVQNADAWSHRDFDRPLRDMKTGMLPPKLARIMVNLGIEQNTTAALLDPFCGGGTVLMEAAVIGIPSILGSDIDREQVDGSQKNIEWLAAQRIVSDPGRIRLIASPAEDLDRVIKEPIDVIVTEGFLGRPLTGDETRETLERNKKEVEKVWKDALPILAKIHKKGGRLVCAWPVFVSSHGMVVVDIKDAAVKAGYRIISPLEGWVDRPPTLTYARPGQRVRRNIVILEKK